MPPPPFTDHVHWNRLRGDTRGVLALGLAALSALLALSALGIVILPGPQAEARQNSTFWLLVIPAAWWLASLMWFEGWAVRLVRPVFLLAAPVCGVAALWAVTLGRDPAFPLGAAVAAIVLAAIGWRIHRDSLIHREGP